MPEEIFTKALDLIHDQTDSYLSDCENKSKKMSPKDKKESEAIVSSLRSSVDGMVQKRRGKCPI